MSLPAEPVRLRRAAARPGLGANAGAATAAVLFGASVVAVRVAVQDIPPLGLAVLRFGQAAVVLVGALLLAAPRLLRVQRRSLPLLALLGVVLFTLFPVTFNAGLRWTEASRGALMLATMPLWSAWLARGVAGERLAGRQLAGVVVSVLGIALAFVEPHGLHGGARALVGDGLLLVTALLGALYGVLANRTLSGRRSCSSRSPQPAWRGTLAHRTDAGPTGKQDLQLLEQLPQGQADAAGFGWRSRSKVRKPCATETRVTWWCQPPKPRPSKWSSPSAPLSSR